MAKIWIQSLFELVFMIITLIVVNIIVSVLSCSSVQSVLFVVRKRGRKQRLSLHESFFARHLPDFQGIPSHDTLNRFVNVLDPIYFEEEFRFQQRIYAPSMSVLQPLMVNRLKARVLIIPPLDHPPISELHLLINFTWQRLGM